MVALKLPLTFVFVQLLYKIPLKSNAKLYREQHWQVNENYIFLMLP